MNEKLDRRLAAWTYGSLWAFALVTLLSIAMQNVFYVALAAWLARRVFVQKRSLGFPLWGWVWLAFMAWALWASCAAPDQADSIRTWKKWLLATMAWCVSDAVEEPRQLRALLGTLLVGAALVNLGASLWFGSQPFWAFAHGRAWPEVASHWVDDIEWRARAGSGGYMILSACDTLILLFFGALAMEDPWWRRKGVLACLGIVALGLILTMTRGAWIASALGLSCLALWRRPRLGLALIGILVLVPFLFPDSVFVRRLKSVGDADNDSNRERIYMAQAGLGILKDHPWLGIGDSLHSYNSTGPDGAVVREKGYFLRYRTPEAVAWYNAKAPEKENGHLHDVPLQLAVMYGIPGMALAALFFLGTFVWALRLRAKAAGTLARGAGLGLAFGLMAFFIHGMTEYNLGSVQSSLTLWFFVGLTAAAARLDAAASPLGAERAGRGRGFKPGGSPGPGVSLLPSAGARPLPRGLKPALALAAALALLRFWLAGRLDLAEDEAYYWEWSRSLAFGYYDQGPGLALAIKLGTLLLGPTEQGVRLLSVLSGFALSSLAAWIVACEFGAEDMALWVVLALNGSLIFAVGGLMMMHDSLMCLGWMGALACGLKALRGPKWWLGVGLCAAWALLSKYTAVLLLACLALSFLCVPAFRRQARTPWPWAGLALACLGGAPMFFWNAAHGWPSFQHIGGLAGGDSSRHHGIPWLEFLGSQAGLVTPLLWWACLAGWAWALGLWRGGRDSDKLRFLLLNSLPVGLFFLALAFHTHVEANWPAAAYVGALPLAACWLKETQGGPGRLGAWALGVAWALTLVVYIQGVAPFLPFTQKTVKADATARMAGWRELGARVYAERGALKAPSFTAVTTYQNAAELAFYQPGQERSVMVSDALPGDQYRFWDLRPLHVGQDAVIAAGQEWEGAEVAAHFQRVERLPDAVYGRGGVEIRRTLLWRAYGFKG